MPKESLNVLLIEDDPAACRLVERTLTCSDESVDYTIDVAHNLKTAENYLRCKNFDSIVLDLQLPDSKGLDALGRIKKITPDVPIVILSAISDHDTGVKAIKEGADYYLVKGRFMREMLGRSICFSVARGRSESVKQQELATRKTQERLTAQVKELSNIAKNTIAERDQLKTHISKLKRQFDAIFNSIPSMIWLRDLQGKIITSNKKARQFFYESIRNVDSNNPEKIFTEALGLSNEENQFIIASGCPLPTKRIEYVNEDEEVVPCEVDCLPYYDNKQEVVGTIVYVKELPKELVIKNTGSVEQIEPATEIRSGSEIAAETEADLVPESELVEKPGKDVQEDDDVIVLEEIDGPARKPQRLPRAKRVLIVEDDPLNQMLMNLHLNVLGVDIVTVDNGEKAIEKVSEELFDLILMDIRMPVLNGRQATMQIRQMGIKVPIIATTADVMGNAKQRCLDAGCNNFICKPIIKKEFYDIISAYIDINVSGLRSRSRVVSDDQICVEM